MRKMLACGAIAWAILAIALQVSVAREYSNNKIEANRSPVDLAKTPPSAMPSLEDGLNRIGSALEAANNKQASRDEENRAKQDLDAQLRMADSAGRMFWVGLAETGITLLGVMLVLATLIYTKRAAEAARDAVSEAEKATKASREIGEAQVRAYLHITSATVDFFNGLDKPAFQAKVVNTGQSPAQNAVCGVQVQYLPQETGGLSSLAVGWRNAVGKAVPIGSEGVTIPVESEPVTFKAKNIDEAIPGIIGVRLMVAYRDVFDKQWEQDAYFVGIVSKADEGDAKGLFPSKWKSKLSPVARAQSWGTET